jgi:hypothetical protein
MSGMMDASSSRAIKRKSGSIAEPRAGIFEAALGEVPQRRGRHHGHLRSWQQRAGFACNIRVHVGRDLSFDGQGDHPRSAYTAFASALERVVKQPRRQKRALREDKPVKAMQEAPL